MGVGDIPSTGASISARKGEKEEKKYDDPIIARRVHIPVTL